MKTNTSTAAADRLAAEIEENPITEVGIPLAQRILKLLSFGLVGGLGDPGPGKMCVEAAVCYAMGEGHGTNPSCVAEDVRSIKIGINDLSGYSSDSMRGRILRHMAIAQLGSIRSEFNVVKFHKHLDTHITREILVPAMCKISKNKAYRRLLANFYTMPVSNALEKMETALNDAKEGSFLHDFFGDYWDEWRSFEDGVQNAASNIEILDDNPYELNDRVLTKLARIVVDALRAGGSPGIKLMDKLCPLPKR